MKNSLPILCLSLALSLHSDADDRQIADAAKPVLEAATKPFAQFASITKAADLQEFPAPGENRPNEVMAAVHSLLWKRIATLNISISAANKTERLANLNALCSMRPWLLKRAAYSNLALASYIEESASIAILAALSTGSVTSEEAGDIRDALAPRTSAQVVLDTIQRYAPESNLISEFKLALAKNEGGSLLDLAQEFARERNELIDTRTASLRTSVHPASLLQYAAQASGTSYMAVGLIDYAAKGGDLNADEGVFRSDLAKSSPEIINKADPGTQIKINAAMFAALRENVLEWRSKQ